MCSTVSRSAACHPFPKPRDSPPPFPGAPRNAAGDCCRDISACLHEGLVYLGSIARYGNPNARRWSIIVFPASDEQTRRLLISWFSRWFTAADRMGKVSDEVEVPRLFEVVADSRHGGWKDGQVSLREATPRAHAEIGDRTSTGQTPRRRGSHRDSAAGGSRIRQSTRCGRRIVRRTDRNRFGTGRRGTTSRNSSRCIVRRRAQSIRFIDDGGRRSGWSSRELCVAEQTSRELLSGRNFRPNDLFWNRSRCWDCDDRDVRRGDD